MIQIYNNGNINVYNNNSLQAYVPPQSYYVGSGSVLVYDANNYASYPNSGSVFYDLSSNAFTASMINGTVPFTSSVSPNYFFYSSSAYGFQVGNNLSSSISGTGGVTIISVAYPLDLTQRSFLFGKFQSTLPYGWALEIGTLTNSWTNTMRWYVAGYSGSTISVDYRGNPGTILPYQTYMFTSTWDYATKTASMLVNLNQLGITSSGSQPTNMDTGWNSGTNLPLMGILQPTDTNDSSMYQYVTYVYNRALSFNEIKSMYNFLGQTYNFNDVVTSGLVYYMNLSYSSSFVSGTNLVKDLANNLTGSYNTLPSYSFSTTQGVNLVYNKNNYLNVTSSTARSLNGISNGPMTISFIVSASVWTTQTLMQKGDGGSVTGFIVSTANNGTQESTIGATGSILFTVLSSGNDLYKLVSGSLSTSSWTQVNITWDGSYSSSAVHIYYNNVEQTYIDSRDGSPTFNSDAPYPMFIGGSGSIATAPTAYFGTGFTGLLPVVLIYNRILSSNELTQNYNKFKLQYSLP
jgi:hypothetical protein